jgi:hypothetical protein
VNREEIGDKIAKLKKDDREKSEGRCGKSNGFVGA